MSEKYNARELAFHYLARLPDTLSEEAYLAKLVEAEAKFTALLEPENPPKPANPLNVWSALGRQP